MSGRVDDRNRDRPGAFAVDSIDGGVRYEKLATLSGLERHVVAVKAGCRNNGIASTLGVVDAGQAKAPAIADEDSQKTPHARGPNGRRCFDRARLDGSRNGRCERRSQNAETNDDPSDKSECSNGDALSGIHEQFDWN